MNKVYQTPPTVFNTGSGKGNNYLPRDTVGGLQIQDDSINIIQETPNSQFRLVLWVRSACPVKAV